MRHSLLGVASLTAVWLSVVPCHGDPIPQPSSDQRARSLLTLTDPSEPKQRQTIDLRTHPPDDGVFLSGNGNQISFCPWLGCDPHRDINVAAGWIRSKTSRGIDHAETGLAIDQYAATGFVPKWMAAHHYAPGDRVLAGENGRLLYQVTKAGRSAAEGSGPTGRGHAIEDGSVTWAFLQIADDTDAKTTLNVTTAVGPNAGHAWSIAANTTLEPGARTSLAVTEELDFLNLSADCAATERNCFLNLWLVEGPKTSTSFVQASAGGDSPALAPDNSSGGAALSGISFSGPNTIRGATFSDGTNAATTLKGWPGTRHVSAFINDASDGPNSYRASGRYSYATWSDVATTPVAIALEGRYKTAQIVGKGWRVAPSGAIATTGVTETVSFTPTSSHSPCETGQHAWDARYEYRCVAPNRWRRASLSDW